MGAQLRVLRQRIKDTQSTKKITHAMELISSSRIARAQQAVEQTLPYAMAMRWALMLAASRSRADHPLLTPTDKVKRAAVLLVTADRGLAGAYSVNAIKEAEGLASNLRDRHIEPVYYIVGRKGLSYYRFRERLVADSWSGFTDQPKFTDAKKVADRLLADFAKDIADGGVDEVHMVYTRYIDRGKQKAHVLRVLPFDVVEELIDTSLYKITGGDDEGGKAALPLYDFEPSAEQTLDALLPVYAEHLVHVALLESAASEHAARQRAMKSATDNAEDLIRKYIRQANQARQAEITQEISEIVGGANALADSH